MPLMRAATIYDYRRGMESVVETMCQLKDSADSREMLRAFAEKRAAELKKGK
jgi:hypothetical protein